MWYHLCMIGVKRSDLQPAAVFDPRTSEVLPVEVQKRKRGPLYTYVGGFMVISVDGLRVIARMRLQGTTMRVLMLLYANLDGCVVHSVSTTAIADRLGVVNSAVSRALTQLELAGLVRRSQVRGVIYVNPNFAFSGSAVKQRTAVKEWDEQMRPREVA
jgi:hypothetical protein